MKYPDTEQWNKHWQHTKSVAQSVFSKTKPFLLYHYITTKCGCRCPYCFYVSGNQNDLSTLELLAIYEQAKDLGYLGTIITGGEPFTRQDIGLILQYIKKTEMNISVMTNGNYLLDRWDEVADNVDQLIISVDIPDDELEKVRRFPDTFQNIVNGIDYVHSHKPVPMVINAILWKENMAYIEDLAIFAKDMNVKINFYPMDPVRTYRNEETDSRQHLALPYSSLSESFQRIDELKSKGYPIINSQSYINHFKEYKPRFQCRFLQIFTQIVANGDVINCSAWSEPMGNVRTTTLDKILSAPQTEKMVKNSRTCNNCNRDEVIDIALAYTWRPDAAKNVFRFF